jgi:type I restriction enzyme S subunit
MVPEGWRFDFPAEIVSLFSGFAFKSTDLTESGARWLKIANVGIGEIKWDDSSYLPDSYKESYRKFYLNVGDIVVAMTRPTLGNQLKIAKLERESDRALLNQRVAKLLVKRKNDSDFVYQLFRAESMAARINAALLGTDPPNLSVSILEDFRIPIPPLHEQRKIAQILSAWDKAITTTEQLLANSQQQKKALMQQLLTGKKRLLDKNGVRFGGEWKNGYLSDLGKITKGKALSSQDLIDGDYPVIAGGKTSPYKHFNFTHENVITVSASGAYAGYVAYHPYKLWASDCSVICKKSGSDIGFIYQLMTHMQEKIYSLQSGGAQPHVYPKDLEILKVNVPLLDEQKKIASVLSASDQEMTELKEKIDALKQEKKALMQQLLTGKRRVMVGE